MSDSDPKRRIPALDAIGGGMTMEQWVDSLVREPGVKIEKLTAKGRVVVVIRSRGYMSVFQRIREEKGFGRVSKRSHRRVMEKVRQNRPKVETITI